MPSSRCQARHGRARPDLVGVDPNPLERGRLRAFARDDAQVDGVETGAFVDLVRLEGTPESEVFETAARELRWHYQRIILREFLPRLIGPDLVASLLDEGPRYYRPRNPPFIPLEFADAAYRYGHSQIRHKYVVNDSSDNVTVITEVANDDTRVRVLCFRPPGDTTSFGRPLLSGLAVNRWTPNSTSITGVLNRVGTAQQSWNCVAISHQFDPDSVPWDYIWGTDSLIAGENFVCCVPLEDQAATTNNLGLGTPFAGNLEVYPVYRVGFAPGLEEEASAGLRMTVLPTIVRGVLVLNGLGTRSGLSENPVMSRAALLDAGGRKVLDLAPGANDVRALAPGVYFVYEEPQAASPRPQTVRKVVLTE